MVLEVNRVDKKLFTLFFWVSSKKNYNIFLGIGLKVKVICVSGFTGC